MRSNGIRTLGLGLSLGAFALGCGGGSDSGGGGTGGGSLNVLFSKAYSAYDGSHTFKVPVMVKGVSGVEWSTPNPELVQIDPLADDASGEGSEAMLTMKGAGSATVIAAAGNLKGQAVITITQAAANAWETGKTRYQDGMGVRMGRTINTGAACTNCHGTMSDDVEHTPAQTGGYTDQELITIFTMGQKPAGVKNRIIPVEQWSPIHRWQMTEEEKAGVVVYLRALEPQSNGTTDFGGMGAFRNNGPRGDGGFGNRGDGGGGNRGDGGRRDGGGGGGGGGNDQDAAAPAGEADAGAPDAV